MKKSYYTISNKTDSAEIRIYGYIHRYASEGNSRRLSTVLREMAEKHQKITIRVNSGGGDVAEAVAIYNIIESTDAHVTIIVEGIAASAMSFICMAADRVIMGKATRLMLHKISGGAWGSAKTMRDRADMMDKWEEDLYSLYADKTGMSEEEIKAKFFQEGKDVWISAKDALKYGLADEIATGTVKKAPSKKIDNIDDLYNHYQTQIDNYYKPTNKTMNKEHLAMIGLPENATEAEIKAKLTELNNRAAAPAPAPVAATPVVNASINDDDAKELEKLRAERVSNLLNKAQAEGKFTAEGRAAFEEMATANYENAEAVINAMPGREKLSFDGKNAGTASNADRSKWTLEDWVKNDHDGLENMAKEEPTKYQALVEKRYSN